MEVDVHALKRTTLATVPDDKVFWVCRGDRINSVRDLANCIESLSPREFEHHVGVDGRNDFAVWIHDVLHNPLLARDLNYPVNLHDKEHLVKTIRDHVTWLEGG